MALDLRVLFDKYHIPWKDKGKNCSRGNVNICCILCGDDRGYHLAISENSPAYYCFRNPRHAGGNLGLVFKALGIPTSAYSDVKFETGIRKEKTDTNDYSEFRYFQPAEESQEALDYLLFRKFSDPVKVSRQFNLRITKTGRWAGRLIIPLTIGWTGRAMRDHLTLRYDSHTSENGYFLHGKSSSIILQEGPLDSMRLASITSEFTVMAMTGKRLSPALLVRLRELKPTSLFFLPDNDVSPAQYFNYLRQLKSYVPVTPVKRLKLPDGVKDSCVMDEITARLWLYGATAA